MLTENSRAIAVTATAEKGGYKYSVDYKTEANKLVNLHCNVTKKTSQEVQTSTGTQAVEQEEYVGTMYQDSGNKQLSFPDTATNIAVHLAVFEEILSEVNTGLISESITAE